MSASMDGGGIGSDAIKRVRRDRAARRELKALHRSALATLLEKSAYRPDRPKSKAISEPTP